jgi:hypothetical protein
MHTKVFYYLQQQENIMKKKPFKPRKLKGTAKEAARKAKIAKDPQYPNRDMSMKYGTNI